MINTTAFPRPVLTVSLVIVGLFGWYMSAMNEPQDQQQDGKLPHVPNYFVRNLTMTSMGLGGLPERHVETIKMVQYLDDETTEMQSPRYTFYRTGQQPWHVQSEQGWLSGDGELALLSGRVTIIRPASDKTAPIKMVTSDLRVQPANNYLETDNAVRANSGNDQIDAIGMQAWMGQPSRIKFLSNVRAYYVPR